MSIKLLLKNKDITEERMNNFDYLKVNKNKTIKYPLKDVYSLRFIVVRDLVLLIYKEDLFINVE